jgi:hypothetical protein
LVYSSVDYNLFIQAGFVGDISKTFEFSGLFGGYQISGGLKNNNFILLGLIKF